MMKRRLPGLHEANCSSAGLPDGIFLVWVERARQQWERHKPFYAVSFLVLAPPHWAGHKIPGRLYSTPKALWKLNWFLRDFHYDSELLERDEIEEKSLTGLKGMVKISHLIVNGRTYVNLEAFAPAEKWQQFAGTGAVASAGSGGFQVTYSYTQISTYLSCPRRYRYRYVERRQEKENRGAMLFGRAMEKALAAYFLKDDCEEVLFKEWSQSRDQLQYSRGDSWDSMLQCGLRLLDRFAQEDRVCVFQPMRHLQVKFTRSISANHDFVAYIDAIAQVDGLRCVVDWKTTSARYPEQPANLLALDPQLVCYSWITGEPHVAFVVFVRKRVCEIQYLHTTITAAQRREFGDLVGHTIAQMEAGHFPIHSGIRFPQNRCTSCPYLGLCLNNKNLVEARLVARTGVDVDWLDQLAY